MRVQRLVAAALVASAVSGCAASHAASPPPVASARSTTPVPAVHHAPAWSAAQLTALRTKLRSALSASALATSGIAIVDADARPLYVQRERTPFAPASTFKVLVAIAALETLGPAFRFETSFEVLDEPHDGAVAGDLYLVGTGDPTLSSDDVRGGVGAVARSGVHSIDGALVADASAFGGTEINRAWDPDDLQYGYAAGTSALSLDQGTVEFHIVPTSVGAPANIVVRPNNDAVRINGAIVTGYETSLSIDRATTRNDFTVAGRIALGAEQSFYRPVANISRYTAEVARTMFAARSIDVRDGVRTGVAPVSGVVLWRHRSRPLIDIVRDMLFESNNHFAEQLLRAVGTTRGAVGTEATGGLVEQALFRRDGVPSNGLHIVDGSGLAASDRIAPISMATLLARAQEDAAGNAFAHALPRVGIEGTVRRRDVTIALGRARAKSGHIENVNALTGYVDTHRHGRVAFTIMVNDPRADDGPVDDGIDRALDILATE